MFTLILFNFSQYTPDLFQFGTNQPNEIYNSPNSETFSMETYKMQSGYIYLPIRVVQNIIRKTITFEILA